ncbi:MAG: gliding motility-associated C-terminal domain-containing protein [Bacteroidota bacterium]
MRHTILICLYSCLPLLLSAQFQTNGSASSTGNNCYIITPAQNSSSGSVWYNNTIDLNQSFELYTTIFLGCNNAGADGMTFSFQSVSTSVGSVGGGMGYSGISPSVAVEFDTYQNGNNADPVFDHTAIVSQGIVSHTAATNLAGPVGILPNNGNVEDCQWHDLHISWNPIGDTLRVYFDCSLRLTYVGDIVNNIFNGNPNVFWGFTAGTGALNNSHQFCYSYISYGANYTICQGDSVPLNVGGGTVYSWSPAAGLSDPASPTPMASPNVTTNYICTITDNCGFQRNETFQVTVNDTIADFSLGIDTTLCNGQSVILDATQPNVNYLWQDNTTNPTLSATNAGWYWVELQTGCDTARDSVEIFNEATPLLNLGPDQTVCDGDTIPLDATVANATNYLWQDGTLTPTYEITSPSLYWVELDNLCGNVRDSLQIDYLPIFSPPDLGADTLLCDNANLLLTVSYPNANYLWSDNSTTPNLIANTAGTYWVQVSNQCSNVRDSIIIATEQSPQVNLGLDSTLCDGLTLNLDASWSAGTSYLWQDGSPAPAFAVTNPGTYWVELENACGEASDTLEIEYLSPPPDFSLGQDELLCEGDTRVLSTSLMDYTYLWSDASTDSSLTVSLPGGLYWLELNNRCGSSRDSIFFNYIEAPKISLGPDETLCEGETRTLNATWPGATYLWDNGSQSPTRTVSSSGIYIVQVNNLCGVDQGIVAYDFLPTPDDFSFGGDQRLCRGDSLRLMQDQGEAFSYRWQDGSAERSFLVQRPGEYALRISNECGQAFDEIDITYLAPPTVDLGNDTVVCTDRAKFITLDASLPQEATYVWQDSSTESFFQVKQPGAYIVNIENDCGVAADSILIEPTRCFCAIHAPTAFTPNEDGLNEQFQLFYDCQIVSGTLRVYNRWGQAVFSTQNPDEVWDGTFLGRKCPEGVYVWAFEFDYTEADRTEIWVERGTVSLIR